MYSAEQIRNEIYRPNSKDCSLDAVNRRILFASIQGRNCVASPVFGMEGVSAEETERIIQNDAKYLRSFGYNVEVKTLFGEKSYLISW